MHQTTWMAGVITIIGALIITLFPVYERYLKKRAPQYIELGEKPADISPPVSNEPVTAKRVLQLFFLVVLFLGLTTLLRYRDLIVANADKLTFAGWLFIFMVGGMFVQVVSSNHREGKGLFEVTGSRLIFPLLFSVVVFYPIWAIAASASHSFFSIHAAFLNGFFWESVVSNATPPKQPNTTKRN